MQFIETKLPGVLVVEPKVFGDARGYFLETYHQQRYQEGGITASFVQDNRSRSIKGTLRGLHYQTSRPQGKLVWVVEGEVFDVAVDIRPNSATFKQWVGIVLSADNFKQLYIPAGYAHGFCVLSETAQFQYKCTDFYDPSGELAIRWNDPELAIDWPLQEPILSAKDGAAPVLSSIMDRLPPA